MDRKRIWGWWAYDWASQPFATLLLTFLFAPYFATIAAGQLIDAGIPNREAMARAQSLWGTGVGLSGLVIALGAPILGAIADQTGRRLPWIRLFSAFYVVAAAALWWTMPEGGLPIWLILALFGLGVIGMEGSAIFTNAMLPTLGPRDRIGRISATGAALGYLGGVVALLIMAMFFVENSKGVTIIGIPPVSGLQGDEGARLSGPFTALWFVLFMIPFFAWVHDPPGRGAPVRLRAALADLALQLRGLRHRRSLAAWLASSMLSRDALNGLYTFGGIYAALVLGWPVIWMAIFGIISAVGAAAITYLGGFGDRRFGPKPMLIAATLVLIATCALLIGMDRTAIFGMPLAEGSPLPDRLMIAAGVVLGGAGGIIQSTGRTMMVRHTTPERATEAFGLYALSGKVTAFVAPLLVAVVGNLTGSLRAGISPLIVMFLAALVLLVWVRAEGDNGA